MINVAVGIIGKDGDALLCQRNRSARYGLKWEFPGGKVEDGENSKDCLRRELFEELGIRADIGELFHRQQFVYPDSGTFDILYYLIPSYEGEIVNRVFESCRWVPITELQSYDLLEGNWDVTEKLVSKYGRIAEEKS